MAKNVETKLQQNSFIEFIIPLLIALYRINSFNDYYYYLNGSFELVCTQVGRGTLIQLPT